MVGMADGEGDAPGVIAAEAVAEAVVQGLAEERFLILPHPVVREFFQRKAGDYDGWLRGMGRLRLKVLAEDGSIDWSKMFDVSAPR
jgi:hypothetical protein